MTIKNFADEVAQLTPKVDLVKVMKKSMIQVLGESSTSAVIYHLGGIEALKKPDVFEERLQNFFGGEADIILNSILKNVKTT